jgi:Flp pilus assembly protein TadD
VSSDDPRDRRRVPWQRPGLGGALLVVAVALTFANALDNGFVYDDQLVIVDDPAVRMPLSAGFTGLRYRPLRTLSYRLDYALGGMDPRVFHLGNVVYHAIAVCLVAATTAELGASLPAALAGALVFAVHPVQTDAVTYAAGRRDVLCGLFYALGVLAYTRHRRSGRAAPLVLAGAAYVLAILAKEMAVTLPLVCLAIDRWERGGAARPEGGRPGSRARWLGYLLALAVAGALALGLTYGAHVLHIARERPWHGGSIGANFATVARVWTKYLQLALWPGTLSVDYSYDAFPVSTSALDPWAVASVAVLALVAGVGWWSWRRGGRLGLGLAVAAIALLPVSHLVPFRELLAEHYLYVPMIGVALAVSGILDDAAARWPARRGALVAATAVVLSALATRSVIRNRDFRDRVTLWSATVAVAPRCARAQYNLGQAYFERNRFVDAERAWLAAAALQPDDRETTRGLAMLYYRLGRHELAAAKIDAVLAASPFDGNALTLAGFIALDRGRPEQAVAYFDGALAVLRRPEDVEKARNGRDRAQRAGARDVTPTADAR